MNFTIDLGNIDFETNNPDSRFEEIKPSDIAIVGMSGKFGSTENLDQFWHGISSGLDLIRDLPDSRKKDIEDFLNNKDIVSYKYAQGSFFNNISGFDCDLFGLSPKEAALIDPNQRLLLREAWIALEKAGYGGNSLKGSNTGVFIGFSSDFGNSYKDYISTNDPASLEMALAGNIKSVIAGRISYFFDLKGPAITFDTACSSALVAMYEASKAIINGECDLSIVGSIKITATPVRCTNYTGIGLQDIHGVESEDGKTRTFDNASTGTGMGEGVGVIILKPLAKAIRDKDNILAVMKGGAINQDGTTLGITAPNSMAQKDAIINAWNDAGVSPETISYIEAHGTGTKLGDPIEIDGIRKAFETYTSRKQFCAIGSVKSNIGHLDHAAGIAGLTKVILSLRKRQIPPLVHFTHPNDKISFIDSPVFVNDKLTEWKTYEDIPRRAGISAFGLSGTNCHLILEEFPEDDKSQSDALSNYFLPLSAKTKTGLFTLIREYLGFLNQQEEIELSSLTKTASAGRGHYNYRLFFIFKSKDELITQLTTALHSEPEKGKNEHYFFGYHTVYQTPTREKQQDERSYEELSMLSNDANHLLSQYAKNGNEDNLCDIALLYTQGADLEWDIYFNNYDISRMELPTYPFNETVCWVTPVANVQPIIIRKEILFPLVDRCELKYDSLFVYSAVLTPDEHWVLSEHKVQGEYVLPGTAYIQMIITQMQTIFDDDSFDFTIHNLYFMHRFALIASTSKELKTIINQKGQIYSFKFVSYDERSSEWILHAEGEIEKAYLKTQDRNDLEQIRQGLPIKRTFGKDDISHRGLATGKRWECNKGVLCNEAKTEFLGLLELDDAFKADLNSYSFHPALADCAINVPNFFVSDDLFLPFSYKKLDIYNALPAVVYAHFILKQSSQEVFTFDVTLTDKEGNLIVKVTDYSIKRISEHPVQLANAKALPNNVLQFEWREVNDKLISNHSFTGKTLIISKESNKDSGLIKLLESGVPSPVYYFFNKHDEVDFRQLINEISAEPYQIIFVSLDDAEKISCNHIDKSELTTLFHLTQAILNTQRYPAGGMYIIAQHAFQVGSELINPFATALLALANNIHTEYPKLGLKLFSIHDESDLDTVFKINPEKESDIVTIAHNTVYKRRLIKKTVKNQHGKAIEFKEDNVYVITGGFGGIGLEIARHLSAKTRCKLILISRRSQDKITIPQLQILSEIESTGSEVILFPADVSSLENMQEVSRKIYSRFESINGIFHCAGIAGEGYLINKSEEVFQRTLQPKIDGSILLETLIGRKGIEFIVFFSSVNALIPENGQTDYATANAFMDAYALLLKSKGIRAISINWPAWEETGMAVDYQVNMLESPFMPIRTGKAMQLIDELINREITSVIPTELNREYITSHKYVFPFAVSENIERQKQQNINNMDTTTTLGSVILKGCDEATETLQKIGSIWGSLLGLKEIDIHESFYNLGGNSVMATSMLKKYEEVFPGIIDIADVFTYTTILTMDNYISSRLNKEQDNNTLSSSSKMTLEDVLNKLSNGEITTAEADALMQEINM